MYLLCSCKSRDLQVLCSMLFMIGRSLKFLFHHVQLHVPKGAKMHYGIAEGWKDFGTIIETDYSDINKTVMEGNAIVYRNGSSLKVQGIEGITQLEIFNISGGGVSNIMSCAESIDISELSAGVYFVRLH